MSTTHGESDQGHTTIGPRCYPDTNEAGAVATQAADTDREANTADDRPVDKPINGSPTLLPDTTSHDGGDDPDVFLQRLYDRHARQLLSFVLRLNGGDWQWAEDVVQETMLRAWKHTASLQGSGSPNFMPWLTTVARRIVLNDQRSRRTRPVEVGDALLALVTVHDDTERAIQNTILKAALTELTPAQRQVVVEKFYRGRTSEEVAHTLGIPAGTVKSRIHYALRILRAVLIDRGVTS
jgi:RNA polymerase sigma-70 factor, ECF subfamily